MHSLPRHKCGGPGHGRGFSPPERLISIPKHVRGWRLERRSGLWGRGGQQDQPAAGLMVMAAKCQVVTRFRNTDRSARPPVGAAAAQPSDRRSARHRGEHPRRPAARRRRRRDRHQSGDRQPGATRTRCCRCSRRSRIKLDIPTQACVLAHVTTTLDLSASGSPVDLVFQSIAGTEAANKSFGIDLALLRRGARRGAVASAAARSATT